MTRGAVAVSRLVVVVAIGLILAVPARTLAQAEKLPKGEDLIAKCIEAGGGKAAMEKIHNRVTKGSIEVPAAGVKGTFTGYEAEPNKSLTILEIQGTTIQQGTDGKVFWELKGAPRILEGDEKQMAERLSTFQMILHWQKFYSKAETVGTEKVGDHDCYKLTMTLKGGATETWFIDQKTNLLARTDMTVKEGGAEIPIQVAMEDYRKVDGLTLSFKSIQTIVAMNLQQVYTIESIKQNVDLPKDRFDLPPEIKALLKDSSSQPASPKESEKPKQPAKP